jgi:hypothetical protein
MKDCRCLVAVFLLAWGVTALRAQATEDNLVPLHNLPEINDANRNIIRAFVGKRVAAVAADKSSAASPAVKELIKECGGTDKAAAPGEAFKRAYVAACVEVIGAEFKNAEVVPATRLITVLNTFGAVEVRPVLIEALTDPRAGVRAAGAIGLRSLRDKLGAAGREAYDAVLAALKEAGKREKARDTLKEIYAALNYADVASSPDARANAAAVLELLDERAKQYAAGQVQALGADDAGLRLAAALAKTLGDDERKRLTVAAGTMLKYALEQYTSGERKLSAVRDSTGNPQVVELRNDMERLVLVGEQLLVALLAPPAPVPAVADGMRKADATEMKNAWKRWVELLQKAVGQDFSLVEVPESQPTTATTKPGSKE